jgi:hypothetical protein
MRQMHRARMFSSHEMDAADHDQTAEGLNPVSERTLRDPERSLQAS